MCSYGKESQLHLQTSLATTEINPQMHRLNNCIYLQSNVIELKIFAKPSIFHSFKILDYRLQNPYTMEEKGVLKAPWKR